MRIGTAGYAARPRLSALVQSLFWTLVAGLPAAAPHRGHLHRAASRASIFFDVLNIFVLLSLFRGRE